MKKISALVLAIIFMFSSSIMAQSRFPHPNYRGERMEFRYGQRPMFNPERRAERMAEELELRSVNALLEKNEAKMLQELSQLK